MCGGWSDQATLLLPQTMTAPLPVTELYLLALILIFAAPYLVWRLLRTDYYAPLVVVQIVGGIVLGPGVLGAAFPGYYQTVFAPPVIGGAERGGMVGGDAVRVCRRAGA